jgi:hypothetical protein
MQMRVVPRTQLQSSDIQNQISEFVAARHATEDTKRRAFLELLDDERDGVGAKRSDNDVKTPTKASADDDVKKH